MKHVLQYFVITLLVMLSGSSMWPALGQTGVLDPNDPILEYPANSPQQPNTGVLAKWVRTDRLNWNTDEYKCYIYNGVMFRLKFPKSYQHNVNDGKTYPLYLFFHGLGESSDESLYDNEYQLFHGGERHKNAVNSGNFDGFLLYPQNLFGFFGNAHYDALAQLIQNYLVPQVKVDINRILVNGLSGGGGASWEFTLRHPRLVAATLPISAAQVAFGNQTNANILKYIPIWHFQGALDGNPDPSTSHALGNGLLAAGATYRYTEYPALGHSSWNAAWSEPDFYPFLLRANKTNPVALFGKYEFCENEVPNVTLGISAGFDGYEWRKNGVIINGASSNTYTVSSFGTYDCRVRRGATWSYWSPIPVVVKVKDPTIPPPITVAPNMSKVLPDANGNNLVTIQLPAGYTSYTWQRVGSSATLSTTESLNVTTPGDYIVKVTEPFSCVSPFSPPFTIINANGPDKPEKAGNILLTPLSGTQMKVDWSDKPNPAFNETNFEVYQATTSGGPYTMVALTNADVLTATISGLTPGVQYYYVVRAINNTGAAPVSVEASGTTTRDTQAPAAPGNLLITNMTNNSIALKWDASTDNVGVSMYDIYINGKISFVTTALTFTCFNLKPDAPFQFVVKARDVAGNVSVPSNQVTGQTILKGLRYKYYVGTYTLLPDFNTLTPVKTGVSNNPSLTPRTQNDNFGFLWQGSISVPVNGIYTFRLRSDDGSKLYIGPYDFNATALVNNDGEHTAQDREGTITLTAGIHPIAIAFFHRTGAETITVSWRTPQTNGSFVTIPDLAYISSPVNYGAAPATASNLTAEAVSFNQVNLNWADNSDNETGFEIERATNPLVAFTTVGKLPANTTAFTDNTVIPNTTYQYRIRAVGNYGESAYDKEAPGVAYSNYELTGMTFLPTFSNLTPTKTGRTSTFNIGIRSRNDNFAIKYEGVITVPTTGDYTFYTNSKNGSKLYIGAFGEANLVVNNDGVHTLQERSGIKTLNAGTYPIYVTYFESTGTGEALTVSYQGPGIAKQVIPATALGQVLTNATTLALPAVPSTPTNLVAATGSASAIDISWDDNATDELGYELYRSGKTNLNYALLATLPANSSTYKDEGLFANNLYYYAVRAKNDGGNSGFSNEASAQTSGNLPHIDVVGNKYMLIGSQLTLSFPVTQTNGAITWSTNNLPGFATFTPNGNSASVNLSPTAANVGTYSNIVVAATDQNGTGTSAFNLVVNAAPVLGSIANVSMKILQQTDISLNVADDPADVISLSVSGLPAFATLTDNGNGSGTIHIEPGNVTGIFSGITVTATDDKGATSSRQFTITVTDNIPSIYVNFSGTNLNVPLPWNSFNTVPFVNRVLSNLVNDNGVATGVSVRLLDTWTGANELGATTGNNTGIFPDDVMKTVYYEGTATPKRIQIAGLTAPNTKYNLVFFASRLGAGDRTTIYSAGGQSVSLNAANNTSNTVQLNGLLPDANGMIEFTCVKASTSPYAYLGALVIQSYEDVGIPFAPSNLVASAKSRTSIQLTWLDKANNEEGVEIYRSESYDGPYSLITTTGADVTSYLDEGLIGSTEYYYKIRNKKLPYYSSYSNISGTSPYAFSLYINFNRQNAAAAPWYNTNRAPEENRLFSNMNNDQGNPTGITMRITQNFSGDNPFGVNTGNNSGIYPDNVIRSTWWVDKGITSQLKFSGLNQTMAYTFVFFASRDADGDRTSIYTINGKSVSLNAARNRSQTVQIDNVRPDMNGEVFVDVSLSQYAQYAYLGAIVLSGYEVADVSSSAGQPVVGMAANQDNPVSENLAEPANTRPASEIVIGKLKGFPNPFVDQVTVSADFQRPQASITLRMMDLNGRLVYTQDFKNIPQGVWNKRIDLSGKVNQTGLYFLQIIGTDVKKTATFKLLKVNK